MVNLTCNGLTPFLTGGLVLVYSFWHLLVNMLEDLPPLLYFSRFSLADQTTGPIMFLRFVTKP